jgi:predicted acyl esterase
MAQLDQRGFVKPHRRGDEDMTQRPEFHAEVVDGMRIEWDVPITMDDGAVLRCDVFRPNDGGRYPVIMGATPYGKLLSFDSEVWGGQWRMLCAHEPEILGLSSNRFQNYEFPDPERFVPDGYALVRVDVRGTGRSPGFMDPLSRRETLDYHQCIEWAAAQSWSSGKVGLSGVSYLAMNQWQVAALRPPHLAAICAWEGCSDFYREFTRHGGIYSTFGDLWFDKYILPVQHGRGERGWRGGINGEWVSGPETLSDAELALNRLDWRTVSRTNRFATDAFWSSRLPDFSRIEAPLLSSANWGGHGLHLRGNIAGFERAGSSRKWLNFHCLEHWTEYYTRAGIALQKRFLAHFLKDEDNGWGSEPRVVMQVRYPKGPSGRETAADWPLAGTQWTRFYLDAATSSLGRLPSADPGSVGFDAGSEGVTFLSAPLEGELRIIGPAAAKLVISSSTEDADLFLILRLFAPDLKEITFAGAQDPHTPIAHGWLRASARKLDAARSRPFQPWHSHDETRKLVPGRPCDLDIEIWPTCIVAPTGYRIGLTVRGRDYEYPGDLNIDYAKFGQPATGVGALRHDDPADRPPEIFAGEVTLHLADSERCYLLLPVVP